MSSWSVVAATMAELNCVIELQSAWSTQQGPALRTGTLESALIAIDAPTRDALNRWLSLRCEPQFHLGAERFEVQWLASTSGNWHVIIELKVGSHRAMLALDGFAALDPLLVGEPFTL